MKYLINGDKNKLEQALSAVQKGSNQRIKFRRTMETYKKVADIVEKETEMVVRFGIVYDNLGSVKEGRANGTLPQTNQGFLGAKSWEKGKENYILNSKYRTLLRCYKSNLFAYKVVRFFKNGIEVPKSEIIDLCTAKEFPKNGNYDAPMFDLSVENIISIGQ